MMKKIVFCFVTLLTFFSCKNHNVDITAFEEEPDSTLYTVINECSDSLLQLSCLGDGKNITCDYRQALKAEKLVGTLTIGDTLAVMIEDSTDIVRSAVNISNLVGKWVIDDDPDRNGLEMTTDNIAVTIGRTADVALKTWKIHNGELIISYVLSDGSDYDYHADTSSVSLMNKDVCHLSLHGTQLKLSRQKGLIVK